MLLRDSLRPLTSALLTLQPRTRDPGLGMVQPTDLGLGLSLEHQRVEHCQHSFACCERPVGRQNSMVERHQGRPSASENHVWTVVLVVPTP